MNNQWGDIVKIDKIDKNFEISADIQREDIEFFDYSDNRFQLYGVLPPDETTEFFHRIPVSVAKKTSEGVEWLNNHTAGGRLRFKTNSKYIAIHTEIFDENIKMPHMPFSGSMSFDLYENIDGKEKFVKAFINSEAVFDGIYDFYNDGMHELTLNFPLYNGVKTLYIGLSKGSTIEKATPYVNEKPIIYYGSSITQGGCASRPGTCYQGYITRRFNTDYINLGFSGSGKAEPAIVEYMSTLPMSMFVLDYDHNAPSPDYLNKTHSYVFNTIRNAHPKIPIIMVSRPDYFNSYNVMDTKERFDIIKRTYDEAKTSGDENVYIIDGRTFFEDFPDAEGSVDGCHPTELGFYFMAKKIGDLKQED